LPHWSIGKLINYYIETRNVFAVNGGPHLRASSRSADYKDCKTLKSCHKEFHFSTGAASYRKADLQIFFLILQSAFSFYIFSLVKIIKSYWELFITFFKIGAFTFGGGYAMIPIMRNEVVNKKKWMEDAVFMDMLAIAQSMPGPIALNTALFVGNKRNGFKGSLFSGLGVILPSFIVILLIAIVFTQFKDNPVIERIFKGIRPAVVALIAAPLIGMGKSAGITWKTLWIPIAVVLLVWLLGISPMYIIVGAIIIGLAYFWFLKLNMKK